MILYDSRCFSITVDKNYNDSLGGYWLQVFTYKGEQPILIFELKGISYPSLSEILELLKFIGITIDT